MSLLPPNATNLEVALDAAFAARLGGLDVFVGDMFNPALCPVALLPWLGWALRVDWDTSWTEEVQRAVIAQSIRIHKNRGTMGSLESALTAAGFEPTDIAEGRPAVLHDGTHRYEGVVTYGSVNRWALVALLYDITTETPWTTAELARIRSIFQRTAAGRSQLDQVLYSDPTADTQPVEDEAPTFERIVAHYYNGTYDHDGSIDYSGQNQTSGAWS